MGWTARGRVDERRDDVEVVVEEDQDEVEEEEEEAEEEEHEGEVDACDGRGHGLKRRLFDDDSVIGEAVRWILVQSCSLL